MKKKRHTQHAVDEQLFCSVKSALYTRNKDTECEYLTSLIHMNICKKVSLHINQNVHEETVKNSDEYNDHLHISCDAVSNLYS